MKALVRHRLLHHTRRRPLAPYCLGYLFLAFPSVRFVHSLLPAACAPSALARPVVVRSAERRWTSTTMAPAATRKGKFADKDDGADGAPAPAAAAAAKGARKPRAPAAKRVAAAVEPETPTATEAAAATERVAKRSKGGDTAATAEVTVKTKVKKVAHQVLTERDALPKLWDAETAAREKGSYTFKVASWNVAGLRGLLKNYPDALAELATKYDLDVLCLQETKLQDAHVDDPKLKLRGHLLEDLGYDGYYSCSTEKKGYAGTAVFVRRQHPAAEKKKQPTLDSFFKANGAKTNSKGKPSEDAKRISQLTPAAVSFQMGIAKHDTEGRLILIDYPLFTLCNVYVPNSGQELKRLQYRIEEWDPDLLAFVQKRQKQRGVPIMWLGDLNVAHTNLEVWNDGAKHLAKQAGVTPEERASFQRMLDAGFVDAFRRLHPTAKGHYSYWSQRAGNREPNKGLRLDYFVCDPMFFDETSKVIVRDSYMVFEQAGSDHCPVVLEIEIKA